MDLTLDEARELREKEEQMVEEALKRKELDDKIEEANTVGDNYPTWKVVNDYQPRHPDSR